MWPTVKLWSPKESTSPNCLGYPLFLSIPRQIRHYVLQLRVTNFGLACNGHAVQAVPHHGLDQGRRKIGALFEHSRKLSLVLHAERGGARITQALALLMHPLMNTVTGIGEIRGAVVDALNAVNRLLN
jgi:hypothetical protein